MRSHLLTDKSDDPDTSLQWIDNYRSSRYGFYITPSSLNWDEWDKWDIFIKKRYPIQFFFREVLATKISRFQGKINRTYWYIRGLIWDRHNVIKLNIPPTWCDTSHKLPLVIEKLLTDFVEKEEAFTRLDWSFTEHHQEAGEAFKEAYRFFKDELPRLDKEQDELLSDLFGNNCKYEKGSGMFETMFRFNQFQEEYIVAKKKDACLAVVKYSEYLWT